MHLHGTQFITSAALVISAADVLKWFF